MKYFRSASGNWGYKTEIHQVKMLYYQLQGTALGRACKVSTVKNHMFIACIFSWIIQIKFHSIKFCIKENKMCRKKQMFMYS